MPRITGIMGSIMGIIGLTGIMGVIRGGMRGGIRLRIIRWACAAGVALRSTAATTAAHPVRIVLVISLPLLEDGSLFRLTPAGGET
jgi:hypothetical protein